MFPFADVMHFFFDEFPGLGGRRFALSLLGLGPLDGRSLGHAISFQLEKVLVDKRL